MDGAAVELEGPGGCAGTKYEQVHPVFVPQTSKTFACKRERVRHRICMPCFTASVTHANNCLLFIPAGPFDMNSGAQFTA